MKTTISITCLLLAVTAFSTTASASILGNQYGGREVALSGPTSRFNEAIANGYNDDVPSTWTAGARSIKSTEGANAVSAVRLGHGIGV